MSTLIIIVIVLFIGVDFLLKWHGRRHLEEQPDDSLENQIDEGPSASDSAPRQIEFDGETIIITNPSHRIELNPSNIDVIEGYQRVLRGEERMFLSVQMKRHVHELHDQMSGFHDFCERAASSGLIPKDYRERLNHPESYQAILYPYDR